MNVSTILSTILQIVGSLCFLLYGMKMMSDGIQKSAGEKLQAALHFMTGNRFTGLLTGCLLTMIIQSSGATTVMVVSFVNAGLISLGQSISVIFGANIGTTITAWIVALFGFNFKISAFAIPLFGLGYILTIIKKWNHQGIGQAVMGFGMLFIALEWLSGAISLNADTMSFLPAIQELGGWSIPIAMLLGILITALIHSSSAMTAIVITMAYNRLLTWEFSAAIIIGSNIGSTIDSIMAAFGGNANAKRTALVHVLFNCTTALLAICLLKPFTTLVDIIVPGKGEAKILASDGVLLGTNVEIAQSFELQRQLNPRIKKPVGHIALSFKPEDKPRLTDEFMAKIALEYMQIMGITKTQCIIARHHNTDNPHCHIVYNRINNEGKLISDRNDYRRNLRVLVLLLSVP